MQATNIEWTDATWNPTSGCTKISPGCAHCYIERTPPMRIAGRKFVGGTIPLVLHEDRLTKPLTWKKPRRIFVNSMSDLFHEDVPDEYIDKVFAVMALAHWHTFQVLTKRPERMREYLSRPYMPGAVCDAAIMSFDRYLHTTEWENGRDKLVGPTYPFPNVHLGVSVENQACANERIPHLLQTPAVVRFLSCEPLLGPIVFKDVPRFNLGGSVGLELLRNLWVIVGGESGRGARPMHPDWARSIRDQCVSAGVPFFFKQGSASNWQDFKNFDAFPDDLKIREFPKGIGT